MLIVDKRNDGELIGDYSSYLFVKHLDYQPLHIDTIVKNIISEFGDGIDILTVKRDAEHLFERLSEFGFVQKSNVQNAFDDRRTRRRNRRVSPPFFCGITGARGGGFDVTGTHRP